MISNPLDSSPYLNPPDHPYEQKHPICKVCGEEFMPQFDEEICAICEVSAGDVKENDSLFA